MNENSSEHHVKFETEISASSIIDELNKNQAYNRNRNQININGNLSDEQASSKAQAATIRNLNDKWIIIQKNTFTNWINEQLKSENEKITDIKQDLSDGVKLIKLVNTLQQPNSKVSKRYFKNPGNQHQCLENMTLVLNAITEDGIKLVNIGNVDLVNGNLKLILGLIWHLILRYQIGKTKIPPKKLILAWIKAVLPQYQPSNLTNDLNDGIVIAGLVNYCNPDLFPDWLSWDRNNKLENCTNAMTIAQDELNIPLVVTPKNMSSPELDELSAITYLSYYIKEGSPGYKATLKWIQSQLPDETITNFSTDWNDGWLLCKLANKMGVSVQGFPNLDRTTREKNCQLGLEACRKLKIETYVNSKELSEPEVESIGVMATAVQFKYAKPIKSANEKAKIVLDDHSGTCAVGKPFGFKIEYLESDVRNIKTNVKGPKSSPAVGTEKIRNGLLNCHFIPGETGKFELFVKCDDHLLDSCPIIINVKADTVKIQLLANEKYTSINQPLEICINPMGAGKGNVIVNSKSPSNKELITKVEEKDHKYYAKIYPNEIGEWSTRVLYDNVEVKGSPYLFEVFDTNQAIIIGLNPNQTHYQISKEICFKVDVSKVGPGRLNAQLINPKTRESRSVECNQLDNLIHEIKFIPNDPGLYRCNLLFNNKHIKGKFCPN